MILQEDLCSQCEKAIPYYSGKPEIHVSSKIKVQVWDTGQVKVRASLSANTHQGRAETGRSTSPQSLRSLCCPEDFLFWTQGL